MSQPTPLRVLLVEDSTNDTFLIVRELQRGGLQVEFERVESAAYMRNALVSKSWDLIICDSCLPQFDGLDALALYREERLDIPFIMVSGMMGEEHALEMIRAGAHDYVPKDNLARLAPAVQRELSAAAERRALMSAGKPEASGGRLPTDPGDQAVKIGPALLSGTSNSQAQPNLKPPA